MEFLYPFSLGWVCRWCCNITDNRVGYEDVHFCHWPIPSSHYRIVLKSMSPVSIKPAGSTSSGFTGKLSGLQHLSLHSYCSRQPNQYFLQQIALKILHCNKKKKKRDFLHSCKKKKNEILILFWYLNKNYFCVTSLLKSSLVAINS